ncbi:MAG: hypothetical protein ABR555_15505, partial [Pyrinomonadaceae bacterium]
MIRPTILSLFFIVLASAALHNQNAFAVRRERLPDKWRPIHYAIAIRLDAQLSEISTAHADIDIRTISRLQSIDLDFGGLTVDDVQLNGSPTQFLHRDDVLKVNLPNFVAAGTNIKITVTYHGKPIDGLILTKDKDGRPSAIGDNWPERVHQW